MAILPFLHAAHQVREAFDGLRFVSFAVIGLAIGALVLTWTRLLAWLRSPDDPAPRLKRWGEDDEGLYFEFVLEPQTEWQAELPDGTRLPLDLRGRNLVRARPGAERPVSLVDSTGRRLRL